LSKLEQHPEKCKSVPKFLKQLVIYDNSVS